MQGQNKHIFRNLQACPLRKLTSSAIISLLTKLLIVLHPTMNSGSAFDKLTVFTIKSIF